MIHRRSFLTGCTAWAFSSLIGETRAAEDGLGHLDHSYWTVADGDGASAAFRRLGFRLTSKPYRQVDGALSTFAPFRDHTYLEIVEDHGADEKTWIANGANPEAAGGLVQSCARTAAFVSKYGVKMMIGQGAGFCYGSFPNDSILSRVFVYSFSPQHRHNNNAEFTQPHANGALGVRESWIVVTDLDRAVKRFTDAGFPIVAPAIAIPCIKVHGVALGWGEHRIVLLQPTDPTSPLGEPLARIGSHPVGVRLAAEMTSATRALASLAEPCGDALLVGPAHAIGGWIAFGREGTWSG